MTVMNVSNKHQPGSFLTHPLGLELLVACILLGMAYVWQLLRPIQLIPHLTWSMRWLAAGFLAALLPLLIIPLLETPAAHRWVGLRGLRDNVDSLLAPLFGTLGWIEMSLLAVLAGLSEEIFFRGVLQQEIGLLAASVAFGLLHTVSVSYVVWATVVGLYLGFWVHMMQSLWPAIVAHIVIDFVGLCYLRLIVAPRCGRPVSSRGPF